jgi:hypothetical protein
MPDKLREGAFYITCGCTREHEIPKDKLDQEILAAHAAAVYHFRNEIDWLKQRIEELEDELFIWRDCVPDKGE